MCELEDEKDVDELLLEEKLEELDELVDEPTDEPVKNKAYTLLGIFFQKQYTCITKYGIIIIIISSNHSNILYVDLEIDLILFKKIKLSCDKFIKVMITKNPTKNITIG